MKETKLVEDLFPLLHFLMPAYLPQSESAFHCTTSACDCYFWMNSLCVRTRNTWSSASGGTYPAVLVVVKLIQLPTPCSQGIRLIQDERVSVTKLSRIRWAPQHMLTDSHFHFILQPFLLTQSAVFPSQTIKPLNTQGPPARLDLVHLWRALFAPQSKRLLT